MAKISESKPESNPKIHDCRRSNRVLAVSLLLFAITAAVFWPACRNGFVNWDDNSYVCDQAEIVEGINWNGLLWASTANVVNNWHPVTLLSLQLDAQLFGTGPAGFHRSAVLIHSINAAMVFLAILALTGCLWRSAAVATLFALHPMRVESVAWISERKDVLSGFFFCLTIIAYAYYIKAPSVRRYLLMAISFALGLSAKSMLVTTPCVLLLLDYWPLHRLKNSSTTEWRRARKLVVEKLPLFALSAMMSVITIFYQQTAIGGLTRFPLEDRVKNATMSVLAYLAQTFWPAGLSPYYPLYHTPTLEFCGGVVVLLGISFLAIRQYTQRPYLLIGWLWFLGMLFPVCGLVQVGNQARADRYTYLPQIGLFLAIVWTVADLARQSRRAVIASTSLCAVFLAGFSFVTIQQIPVWHNTESLWRRVYEFNPDNGTVIDFLLTSLINTGKKDEALRITNEAIRTCDESDADKMRMLSMFLWNLNENAACVQTLDKALKFHPEDPDLHARRGKAQAAQGHWEEAVEDYRRASQLPPHTATYEFCMAHALRRTGRTEKSRQVYAAALRQSPSWPQEAAKHAWRMSTSAKTRELVFDFWPVCLAEAANDAKDEKSAENLDILAAVYAHSGRFEEAISVANQALQLAENGKQTSLASAIRERLKLYEQRQPYRQPNKSHPLVQIVQ